MSATFGMERALKNRSNFISSLGLNPNNLVILEQVHGDKVIKIDSSYIGPAQKNEAVVNADSMITNDPNIVLVIISFWSFFSADYLPIFLYDKKIGSFGIAHAGQKGTVKNIAGKTVEAMKNNFKSNPQNIKIVFGSSIHNCHYDQQLPQDKKKLDEFRSLFPKAVVARNGKYYFNLIAANSRQLIKAGIKENNINAKLSECTQCRNDSYWSYHKPQKLEGVMMSVIGIN